MNEIEKCMGAMLEAAYNIGGDLIFDSMIPTPNACYLQYLVVFPV